MPCAPSPRRRFLEILVQGGALASAASLGLGCGGGPSGSYDAGNVTSVPEGTLRVVDGAAVAIGRDTGGLYAMTLICTHAGCDMSSQGEVSSTGVICDCHGSVFNVDGGVVSGPAGSPLEHFAVAVSAKGEITIDADTVVGEDVRTAV